jgi:hypothetical protein
MSLTEEESRKLLSRSKAKATKAAGDFWLAKELHELQFGNKILSKKIKEKKTDPLKAKRAAGKKAAEKMIKKKAEAKKEAKTIKKKKMVAKKTVVVEEEASSVSASSSSE